MTGGCWLLVRPISEKLHRGDGLVYGLLLMVILLLAVGDVQ